MTPLFGLGWVALYPLYDKKETLDMRNLSDIEVCLIKNTEMKNKIDVNAHCKGTKNAF